MNILNVAGAGIGYVMTRRPCLHCAPWSVVKLNQRLEEKRLWLQSDVSHDEEKQGW